MTVFDMRPGGESYSGLVELPQMQVIHDMGEPQRAEVEARRQQRDKLEPALKERLAQATPDEEITVAFWLNVEPDYSLSSRQQRVYAKLAQRHLAAQKAMEQGHTPLAVSDRTQAAQIYRDYLELMAAEPLPSVERFVQVLHSRGFQPQTFMGVPAVVVTMPKHVIKTLMKRPEVETVYLAETKPLPLLDVSVPTILAPSVWQQGYEGNGVTIGILEDDNVDRNNSFLRHAATWRNSPNGIGNGHATWVASVAASFHDTYRGVAPEATILSVGTASTEGDTIAGLEEAFRDYGADVVNYSERFQEDANLNNSDRAFDYMATLYRRLIVVAAGNSETSDFVASPGKAWNVLTVGAFDDNNTTSWDDDDMWADSAWINPSSNHNDKEKPEVVAPGANITLIGLNNASVTLSGTSLAAPHVAGLAALLFDRESSLIAQPEATRSILMASATHNITGPVAIPVGPGIDLEDGAGAINAAYADTIARNGLSTLNDTCTSSCWWTQVFSTTTPATVEIPFVATAGDRIRSVIAWHSRNYPFLYNDNLTANLDLFVRDPNGRLVTDVLSNSQDNSYEMVDFVAGVSGTYRLRIQRLSIASGEINHLGVTLLRLRQVFIPLVLND